MLDACSGAQISLIVPQALLSFLEAREMTRITVNMAVAPGPQNMWRSCTRSSNTDYVTGLVENK